MLAGIAVCPPNKRIPEQHQASLHSGGKPGQAIENYRAGMCRLHLAVGTVMRKRSRSVAHSANAEGFNLAVGTDQDSAFPGAFIELHRINIRTIRGDRS